MPLTKEEKIKQTKHPLDAWEDLLRASREGFTSIRPDDFLRFKWFGIYQQRPKTDPYFMLRLKIPGGRLTSKQVRAIAEVAKDQGRGIADITTRQDFQFHWLKIENIPNVLEKFDAIGITAKGAGGDIARNITGSPLAGLETDEVDDLQDIIRILQDEFLKSRELANLPRKFKASITGGSTDAAQPGINDVGIYGFWKDAGKNTPAFAICVGGGLSSDPMFAKPLPVALKREEIVPAVMAALKIFHDHGNRENRRRARMKFLVEEWGLEKFLSEMEKQAGRTFQRLDSVPYTRNDRERFWGILPQKQKGFYAVGLAVLAGRLSAKQLSDLAAMSDQYGDGQLRTTNKQNILLVNIPEKNLEPLQNELLAKGFDLGKNGFSRSIVVCTGREFCNLALVEVKEFAARLTGRLKTTFPDFQETLTIHITGCPNSCGQYQMADIGLLGAVKVVEGVRRDAFHIAVGAKAGEGEAWNRRLFSAVRVEEVPQLIEKMVRVYLEKHLEGESFSSFCNRFSREELTRFFEHHATA